MLLTSLQINNFRLLDDFVVPALGRVNLIVGRNSAGKSIVLEALRILATRGDPRVLQQILEERGETSLIEKSAAETGDASGYLALRHLFPKRRFPLSDDVAISIGDQNNVGLKIEHVFYRMDQNEAGQQAKRVLIPKKSPGALSDSQGQAIKITPVGLDSFYLDENSKGFRHHAWDSGFVAKYPSSVVPARLFSSDELAERWDSIALMFETNVIEALKLVEPDLLGITFIKNEAPIVAGKQDTNFRIGVAKLSGSDERIPLSSMGDGMLRILQIVLAVFPAQNGMLLIDEFENGLHYSVQEKVWALIFHLAKELDIQVFATTHSWDCIESFTKAASDSSEDGVLFKMSRSRLTSDNGKIIATFYDEEALKTVTASELEVR